MICHAVEQRSDDWYALRVGKPSASEFAKIVTSKGEPSKSAETYAYTLAAELYAGKPLEAWEGSQWTERGREMEAEAIAYYEFMTETEVMPVGFVTDDAEAIGCSPDGFVGDDGLIEVKCLKPENHVKTILYYQKHGRCPTDYVQQPQGQMMICERQWVDLVFYHPALPVLVIRQEPDDAVVKGLREQLPALVKRRDEVLAALHREAAPGRAAA